MANNGIEQLITAMLKATGGGDRFANAEVHIKREGTRITLPSEPFPMSYAEAITCLQRRIQEEEEVIAVHEDVDAFPFDGAHAFMEAMKQTYGWASPQARETFFGKIPPKTINLEIGYGVYTQIIWGDFKIPGMEGVLTTGVTSKDGRPIFKIGGEVKKKHQQDVAALAALTRQIVKERSIYKGKAITLKTNDQGEVQFDRPPGFLDLSRVNPDELTFSDEVAAQVETNLWCPVENTDACRLHHIPLKRGVLLEGPFGTGKTLTAFVTAQKAAKNGWTFIMLDRVSGLNQALTFARMYQPAVVFAEDVDREVQGQDRTVAIDDILNTIDGIESKGSEVITILTSNDVKGINRAMLRPGRLDAIISVQAPDAKAAQKLIRLYSRGLIADDVDLSAAGTELKGQIPATIREVVERSKLYAISREKSGKITLTCDDLVHSARGMKQHLELMSPNKEAPLSVYEKTGLAFGDLVAHAVKGNGLYEAATKAKENTQELLDRL